MLALALVGGIGAGAVGLASANSSANTSAADAVSVTGQPSAVAQERGLMKVKGPGVHGTVSSVSGTTLIVTDPNGTAYTVDASKATVMKAQATASVSDIAVGDTVGVRGTVNGTQVTATDIMDGLFEMRRGPPGGRMGEYKMAGAVGTVTSINGSTITITATDASAVSALSVGDSVMVHGKAVTTQ